MGLKLKYISLALLLTAGLAYAGLETSFDYIDDLVITNPADSDNPSQADDHMRGIKKAVTQSFPNVDGAVTPTPAEFNVLDGVTGGTVTASLAVVVDGSKDIGTFNNVTSTTFTGNLTGNVTGDLTGDLTGNVTATSVLADGVTATTQSQGDNSTKPATTAYVDALAITEDYILIQDRKTAGTDGGTATSGAWRTRDLNTETEDAGGHASLASNQITLAEGTYRVKVVAPVYAVIGHNARLYDVSNSVVLQGVGGEDLYGTSGYSSSNYSKNDSVIAGRFEVPAGGKIIRVEHRVNSTVSSNGFGRAGGFGEEIYTQVELWKEN